MSLDQPKYFGEYLFSGGVLGKVFKNEDYGVYTPLDEQNQITLRPLTISIITKSNPRDIISAPIEKLYKDPRTLSETAEYLVNSHKALPSKEFTKTTKKILMN